MATAGRSVASAVVPKERKAESSRKPPAAAASHDVVDEWIAAVMPAVHPLVVAVDELICATVPDLQYAIKWSKAHYGLAELGWILEVAAYHKSVNVVFYAGADFTPPPALGETGRSRYVKLHALDDVHTPELRSWIRQAATLPGWR